MKDTTTTKTTTRVDIRKKLADGHLDPLEERVVRMRHGITEKRNAELKLKDIPNDETRARLAMIEKMALDRMAGHKEPAPRAETSTHRKDHIIERLRRAKKSSR